MRPPHLLAVYYTLIQWWPNLWYRHVIVGWKPIMNGMIVLICMPVATFTIWLFSMFSGKFDQHLSLYCGSVKRNSCQGRDWVLTKDVHVLYLISGIKLRIKAQHSYWKGDFLSSNCYTEYPVEGCGYPGEPANGQTSMSPDEKSSVGDVSTVDCDAGFELQGLSNRTCTTDGEWSSNPPTCNSKYRKNHTIIIKLR